MVSLWPAFCVFLPGILIAQPIIVGGPQNIPVNRSDVIEMAEFSVDKYNKKSTDEYLVNEIQIIKATMQVIAGRRYALDVLIGQAQCKKNSFPRKVHSVFFYKTSFSSRVSCAAGGKLQKEKCICPDWSLSQKAMGTGTGTNKFCMMPAHCGVNILTHQGMI
uniref:Cystatin domain-containing protein n=1 Tax=Erpetoichthys calabaricus TaxID=27687 RepID=A0A8C4SPP7_ERPCA